MGTPVRYGAHRPQYPGPSCELCSTALARPLVDHCHAHGWVRGTLCSSCNTRMAALVEALDRRRRRTG